MTTTGYLSIADLGRSIILTGTDAFIDLPFRRTATSPDETLFDCEEGPNFVTLQVYAYPVPGNPVADRWPRGAIIQTNRANGDGTAEESWDFPERWPFGWRPKVYTILDFVSAGNTGRGIRLRLPKGEKLEIRTHVLKIENAAAYLAARITPRADD